jgi:hypothetical protein
MSTRAEMLRQTGYLNAAEWCEHIQHNLHLYPKYPNDLVIDTKYLLESFKNDFLNRVEGGTRKLRQECFEVVQVLLERAIENDANINETLKQLTPYVDRSLIANKPIYQVDEAFNALDESLLEIKVYGYLFTFMLAVDGQYFPTIKTLCALKLVGSRQGFVMEFIEGLNLSQMKNLIGEFGSPIFIIYDSVGRHLRNAIAHCNFAYNNETLTCWDVDPRSGEIIWQKDFTIYELLGIINDLKSIEQAFVTWNVVRAFAEKLTRKVGHRGLQLNFKYVDRDLGKRNIIGEKF